MASSMAWPWAARSWGQGTAISTPLPSPSPRALSAEDGNIVSGTPWRSQLLKEKDRERSYRGLCHVKHTNEFSCLLFIPDIIWCLEATLA
ncbi:hypothetical protein Nmel_006097 [Mimus melanotis]